MPDTKMKLNKLFAKLGIILIMASMTVLTIPTGPAIAAGQYIDIQPKHGPAGTKVYVYGEGFSPSINTTIVFAKTYFPDKNTLVKTTVIDAWGNFETDFVVGESAVGKHKVWVYDGAASPPVWRSLVFTVEPQMKLGKTSGYVGDNLTVSGTGFADSSNVSIYFDDSAITTVSTTSNGSFANTAITIPSSHNGSHIITAVDAGNNQHTGEFITKQRIFISPTSGPIGTEATINGTGFAGGQPITVSLDYNTVITSPIRTSPTGNFTGKFYLPGYAVSTYTVEASDGSNKADTTFKVTFGGKLNRIVGYIGSEVTFAGTGFIPGRVANIHYDDAPLAEATVGTNGNLSVSFKIPASSAGEHTILVTDGTNSTQHTFTVFPTAFVEVNRNIGYISSQTTLSGIGFIAGRIITIYYDDIPVAETTINASGNFTASFKIPASPGGKHTVSTSDGINSANTTLIIESIPPPAPVLLLPTDTGEMGAETGFTWEDISDPSGVTYHLQISSNTSFISGNATSLLLEKSGLTIARYILTPKEELEPTKKGAPYYWRVRAVDNAANTGNWSIIREFHIGTSRSPWFLFSVIAEGGMFSLLFGFWIVRRRS